MREREGRNRKKEREGWKENDIEGLGRDKER